MRLVKVTVRVNMSRNGYVAVFLVVLPRTYLLNLITGSCYKWRELYIPKDRPNNRRWSKRCLGYYGLAPYSCEIQPYSWILTSSERSEPAAILR